MPSRIVFKTLGKDATAEGLSRSLGLYNSTQEVDFEQINDDAVAALAIEVHETDESFGHAFGTHRQFGWEASEEVGEVAVEFLTLANDMVKVGCGKVKLGWGEGRWVECGETGRVGG